MKKVSKLCVKCKHKKVCPYKRRTVKRCHWFEDIDSGEKENKELICKYCEKKIGEKELIFDEDTQPCHIRCLKRYEEIWEERSIINMLGKSNKQY